GGRAFLGRLGGFVIGVFAATANRLAGGAGPGPHGTAAVFTTPPTRCRNRPRPRPDFLRRLDRFIDRALGHAVDGEDLLALFAANLLAFQLIRQRVRGAASGTGHLDRHGSGLLEEEKDNRRGTTRF